MPLPPSVPRKEIHRRDIEMHGYLREDGLYDMEAHLKDTKAGPHRLVSGRELAPGQPVHEMWIRLVVDEDLNVIDIVAATDASPFDVCREAPPVLEALKGARIGPGWSEAIRQHLGGRKGCTHLAELLRPLGSTAMQTLSVLRNSRPPALDANGRPRKVDSCYAYASDREVVLMRWPQHYDGPPKG